MLREQLWKRFPASQVAPGSRPGSVGAPEVVSKTSFGLISTRSAGRSGFTAGFSQPALRWPSHGLGRPMGEELSSEGAELLVCPACQRSLVSGNTQKGFFGLALGVELPNQPPAHLVLPQGKSPRAVTLACSSLTIPPSIASNTYSKSELIKERVYGLFKDFPG